MMRTCAALLFTLMTAPTWAAPTAPKVIEPLPADVPRQCEALLQDYHDFTRLRPRKAPLAGPTCAEGAAVPRALQFCRGLLSVGGDGLRTKDASVITNGALQAATMTLAEVRSTLLRQLNLRSVKVPDDQPERAAVKRAEEAELDEQLDAVDLCASAERESISGSVAAGSFLPQDALIRGLANVVGARLKAELALALQERVLQRLCQADDSDAQESDAAPTSGARVLFGATCGLLTQLDAGSSLSPPPWTVIRAAIREDLDALPRRVAMLTVPDDKAALRDAIALATDILTRVRDGRDLAKVLAGLKPGVTETTCATFDTDCVRLLLADLMVVLSAPGSPAEPHIYAQMVLARLKSDPALARLWPAGDDSHRLDALIEARALLEEIRTLLKGGMAGESAQEHLTYIAKYLDKVARLLEQGAIVFSGELDCPDCIAQTVAESARQLADLLAAVDARDYPQALLHVLALYRAHAGDTPTPGWLVDYGPFLAELAASKDAASAQTIIEAAAAPIGSYRGKRVDGFSLTLSALPGIQIGGEWLTNDELEFATGAATHLGLFAPVGLDLAWALPGEGSLGLFVSILDLGALVDFRLGGDAVKTDDGMTTADAQSSPQVGFAQVVSPGVYLNLGVWQTPIVMGFGAAYSPNLRKIDGAVVFDEASALQLSGFVGVDVALFSIVR